MTRERDPETALPLPPQDLEILIALGAGPAHGYGIISQVREQSDGAVALSTSSLYAALKRMEERGLVEDAGRSSTPSGGPPRRYFRVTDFGRRVARLEALRMESAAARAAERFRDPRAQPSGDSR